MLDGKNILIIGARSGGYGESIARSAVRSGARVFGTSLSPGDPREAAFFEQLGAKLVGVPLKYDFDRRASVFEQLDAIEQWLKSSGVERLDAIVHTVAGGFPRQPSVMKAVGEILKGNDTFENMATAVKRNVYYVNAGSFEDTINGLAGLTHDQTHFVALTYRGDLPYFIRHTKKYLERIALRLGAKGKRTLITALPEAWTQSSQFFTGIEIAIIHNYLKDLEGRPVVREELADAYYAMERSLTEMEGFPGLLETLQGFLRDQWTEITSSADIAKLYNGVQDIFGRLRADGMFPVLRRAVEIISDFVRVASGTIVVSEFLDQGRYQPGDVRQVFYSDLTCRTEIKAAKPPEPRRSASAKNRVWVSCGKDEIRETLSMYGENFLFLDRAVIELGDLRDGLIGFGTYTVPTPEENPILKDHFVGLPLFGGHLQMEAVAQLGTFLTLKLLKEKRLVPILTGTEFPDLNTMAPPGEKLTMMGTIRLAGKRRLACEAFIENRYARSRGTVRGMVIPERLARKTMTAFNANDEDD